MCRFLALLGKEVLLADFFYLPKNSLLRQSFKARERIELLNRDGFGAGWNTREITTTETVFTSVTLAFGNRRLRRLVKHVKSSCFVASRSSARTGGDYVRWSRSM